jgi:N-acetylglucosaminyldiphosphoundecaprenol N-acetyl-beta-D-mannosaminyltransferase
VILGYPISNNCLENNIKLLSNFLESGEHGFYMACANPHSLVVATKDLLFQEALKKADILLPDGIGIIFAAKALRVKIKKRIAGFDFFYNVSKELASKSNLRYFFLGSSQPVLELISQRMSSEFPSIKVCGTYSPPFKNDFTNDENEAMIKQINSAKPDILWVGMTAPKQEKWIFCHRHELDVPFSAAIGAVFDFYAGTRKRSSVYWQNAGLEWLPRFLREPNRLYERNLKSTPLFLFMIFKELLRNCS